MAIKKDKLQYRKNAILRLLELIEGTNKEIEISKKMNSNLMVKQAKYLKSQYTKELFELLNLHF